MTMEMLKQFAKCLHAIPCILSVSYVSVTPSEQLEIQQKIYLSDISTMFGVIIKAFPSKNLFGKICSKITSATLFNAFPLYF